MFPIRLPGVEGAVFPATDSVLAVLLPQLLLAVTEIVPPLPAVVTVILLVVEVPLHPEGSVHV